MKEQLWIDVSPPPQPPPPPAGGSRSEREKVVCDADGLTMDTAAREAGNERRDATTGGAFPGGGSAVSRRLDEEHVEATRERMLRSEPSWWWLEIVRAP
jgi:hypothetical protein